MQVLLVNGSPHKNGNTGLALSMLDNFFREKILQQSGFKFLINHCVAVWGVMDVTVKTDAYSMTTFAMS